MVKPLILLLAFSFSGFQQNPLSPFTWLADAFQPFAKEQSGPTFDQEVASIQEMYSLTGIPTGWKVLVGSSILQYNGPSTPDVAGLTVTDGGTAGDAGVYIIFVPDPSHNSYVGVNDGSLTISWDTDHWITLGNYRTTAPADDQFPWNAVFDDLHGNDSPAPTITRNDVASEANWTLIP